MSHESGHRATHEESRVNPGVYLSVSQSHAQLAPGRRVGGTEHMEVRLSWIADRDIPDQGRMVAGVRALVDLLLDGRMPLPLRVDAMHALTHSGLMAQRIVNHAATALGERPTVDSGSVFVVARLGRTVSYTMHGFLR